MLIVQPLFETHTSGLSDCVASCQFKIELFKKKRREYPYTLATVMFLEINLDYYFNFSDAFMTSMKHQ